MSLGILAEGVCFALGKDRGIVRAFSMIGQFGINMIVPIFLCSFAGILIDKRIGTGYLVILGFFLGAVAGGYNVYRMARSIYGKGSPTAPYEGSGSRADQKDLNGGEDKKYDEPDAV